MPHAAQAPHQPPPRKHYRPYHHAQQQKYRELHRHPPPFEWRPIAGAPGLVRIAQHDVVGRARPAIGTDGKQAKLVACRRDCINEWLAPVIAQSGWGHTLRTMAACTVPARQKVFQLDRQLPTTGMECLDRGLQPRQVGFHDQIGATRAVDRAAGGADHAQAEHGKEESGPAPEMLIRPWRRPCHWLLARSLTPLAHTSRAVLRHAMRQRGTTARLQSAAELSNAVRPRRRSLLLQACPSTRTRILPAAQSCTVSECVGIE